MAIINGTVGKNGYSFYAELIETIPSDYITTNRTNYSLKIYVKNGSMRFNSNHWKKYLKINGTEVYNETGQNINSTVVGYGEAFAVMTVDAGQPHNADGTYTVSIEASLSKDSYGSYDPGYCYLKGDIPLTTIPRTSSVTATDGYINDGSRPVSIHINTATTAFTHTLRYTFGSLSGTIATKYQYLDYGWNLPTSLYTQIPNNTSGTGTIYCDTYNGDTLIGTSSVAFTARVDESQNKPTVSSTVVDTNKTLPTGYTTNGLTGSAYKFIKGVSNAQVSISATAKNSASITGYRIVNNSRVYTSNSFTIENLDDAYFDVSATDSRGFVGYQSGNPTAVTMINYVGLTVNPNVYRPEPTSGEVVLSVSGNYFSGSFGTQNNSLEVKYRFKESSASWDGVTYKTITATIDSTNSKYSVSLSLGTGFDYQKSYDFEIVGTDKIKSISKTYRVSEGIPMFAMFKDHLESFGNKLADNGGNLYLPTTKSIYNGNNDILRHNGTATVVSSTGDRVYLRPNGTTSTSGELSVDTDGVVRTSNHISIPSSGAIYIGGNIALHNSATTNESFVCATGGPVVFRPNGLNNATGQAFVNTVGDMSIAGSLYAGYGASFGTAIYAPNYYYPGGSMKAVFGTNVHVLGMTSSPYLEVQTDLINGVTAFGINVWASDKRLKSSIADSKINALEIIKQMKHREFNYKPSSEFVKIGYVADELQEIDDSLIFEVGEDKLKQPKESVIIPILSKAIQEQQEYIEKLEERITKLEEIINNIQ